MIKTNISVSELSKNSLNKGGIFLTPTSFEKGVEEYTSGTNLKVVNFQKYLNTAAMTEVIKSIRIPLPNLRWSELIPTSGSEDSIPLTELTGYRNLVTFLATYSANMTELLGSRPKDKTSKEVLQNISDTVISGLDVKAGGSVEDEFLLLMKNTASGKDASEVSKLITKDIHSSFRSFLMGFYNEVYLRENVTQFLANPTDWELAKKDLSLIIQLLKTSFTSLSSEDLASSTLPNLIQTLSPQTRAIYSYMDRLTLREEDNFKTTLASADQTITVFRDLFPKLYDLFVQVDNKAYRNTPVESSTVLAPKTLSLEPLTFTQAGIISAGLITGQPIKEEDDRIATWKASKKEEGDDDIINLLEEITAGSSVDFGQGLLPYGSTVGLSDFVGSTRKNVSLASRLVMIHNSGELSNIIDQNIPNLLPDNWPAEVYSQIGVPIRRLFNAAILCYTSSLEADKCVSYVFNSYIASIQEDSHIYRKLPPFSNPSKGEGMEGTDAVHGEPLLKRAMDEVLNKPNMVFDFVFHHWLSVPDIHDGHKIRRGIDTVVKEFSTIVEHSKMLRKLSPGLTLINTDATYIYAKHMSLGKWYGEFTFATGADTYGGVNIPSVVGPLSPDYRIIKRKIEKEARTTFTPYEKEVGLVIGDKELWDQLNKRMGVESSSLPMLYMDKMVDLIPDSKEGVLPSNVLVALPSPFYMKRREHMEAKVMFNQTINYFPEGMFANLGMDFEIVRPPTEYSSISESIVAALIGDGYDLDIRTLKKHPNAQYFFKNLKKAKKIDELELRFVNPTMVEAPQMENLRFTYIFEMPDVSDFVHDIVIAPYDRDSILMDYSSKKDDVRTRLEDILKVKAGTLPVTIFSKMQFRVLRGTRNDMLKESKDIAQLMAARYVF